MIGFVLGAVAALALGQGPVGQGGAAQEPITFRVTAIDASNTGRGEVQIDPRAQGLESAFEGLAWDTYEVTAQNEAESFPGIETAIPVDVDWTFYAQPLAQGDDGQLEVGTRVVQNTPNGPVNAILARGSVTPGRSLIYRGIPTENGARILVLTYVPPDDPSEGGGDAEQQPSEETEENESAEQNEPQEQESNADESEAGEEDSERDERIEEGEPDSEEPMDLDEIEPEAEMEDPEGEMAAPSTGSDTGSEPNDLTLQNAEAILDSLEEADRREQEYVRNENQRMRRVVEAWW